MGMSNGFGTIAAMVCPIATEMLTKNRVCFITCPACLLVAVDHVTAMHECHWLAVLKDHNYFSIHGTQQNCACVHSHWLPACHVIETWQCYWLCRSARSGRRCSLLPPSSTSRVSSSTLYLPRVRSSHGPTPLQPSTTKRGSHRWTATRPHHSTAGWRHTVPLTARRHWPMAVEAITSCVPQSTPSSSNCSQRKMILGRGNISSSRMGVGEGQHPLSLPLRGVTTSTLSYSNVWLISLVDWLIDWFRRHRPACRPRNLMRLDWTNVHSVR